MNDAIHKVLCPSPILSQISYFSCWPGPTAVGGVGVHLAYMYCRYTLGVAYGVRHQQSYAGIGPSIQTVKQSQCADVVPHSDFEIKEIIESA